MNNLESGNVPQTIDSKGNIIPKPYGVSRWANPRVYKCTHQNCNDSATVLDTVGKPHNCCGAHEEGAVV